MSLLSALGGALSAEEIHLMWDPSADAGLAGYRVHCGVSSGQYDTVYDAGMRNEAIIPVDDHGATLYFAVTAYNSAGVESVPSNEVIYRSETKQCAPVAVAGSVSVPEDQSVTIRLEGSDSDGGQVTFSIVRAPKHGTLSGILPNAVYRPAPDFHGFDSFEFAVSHGANRSAPVTVSIDVTPVNDRPTALASGVETVSGVPVPVILKGEDIDGDTLSFRIVRGPSNGRLVGKAPGLTYEPASSFAGTDSFDFVVSDGREESSPARVTIHVAGGNRAPVAFASSVQVKEDASVAVKLNAKDDDGDPLTYRISRAPAKGKLSGKAPSLTYTPAPDFNGADSFDFEVSDGKLSSAATVSIKVLPVNDPPKAIAVSRSMEEDLWGSVVLEGTDPDGDRLTFKIESSPANGFVTGVPPRVTYKPKKDFSGTDTFTFSVSDGKETRTATATIHVTPVNDKPIAVSRSIWVFGHAGTAMTLTGNDVDGDKLTFAITRQPAHGKLTGTAPKLTYTPNKGYTGEDSFEFVAKDKSLTSAPGRISITVVAGVKSQPTAAEDSLIVLPGETTGLLVNGAASVLANDEAESGDTMTAVLRQPPTHGVVELRPDGTFTYRHDGGSEFADFFTYSASGSGGQSDETTVNIRVLQIVDLRQVDEQLEFDFSVIPAVEYQVEYQDGTAEGNAWQELTRFTSEEEGIATVTDTTVSAGALRFYRVRCVGAHGELVTEAWGLERLAPSSGQAVSPVNGGGLAGGPIGLTPAGVTQR